MVNCGACKAGFADYINLRYHVRKFHPEKLDVLVPKIKKKEGKCICQICKATYVNIKDLRRHIRQKHPDKSEELAPIIKKIYTCQDCSAKFDMLKQLKLHKTKNHTTSRRKVWNCPLCEYKETSDNLIIHYQTEHSLNIHTEKLEFETFEAFQEWKYNMEKETYSSFINRMGVTQSTDAKKIYYICHRSGDYKRQGNNIRSLKSQGSNKIGAYCPAEIRLVIEKSRCVAQFCKTHVGHQLNDLEHLTLSKLDRQKVAFKVAANVPLKTILNEIKNTVSNCQMERIHLLTKKDLYNIRTSFKQNQSVLCHNNDADSEDSSNKIGENSLDNLIIDHDEIEKGNQPSNIVSAISKSQTTNLTKPQEKAIIECNKIIDRIKTAQTDEEVYAAIKLIKPIEPTMIAIRQKNSIMPSLQCTYDIPKDSE